MNGQWIGNILYHKNTCIILNLEPKDKSYEGRFILLFLKNQNLVSLVTEVKINKKDFNRNNGIFKGKLYNFLPISPENGLVGSWEDTNIPKDKIPKRGEIKGCCKKNKITGECKTNGDKKYIKYKLYFYSSNKPSKPSKYTSEKISWEYFKYMVTKYYQHSKYIFRGQAGTKDGKQWRLRTSFHNIGRTDYFRYRDEDIPELYRIISAFPDCKFDLDKPQEYNSLLALARHHDYPSPLIDWTHSPYIAAYFAFSATSKDTKDGCVRIFVFNLDKWKREADLLNKIDKKTFSLLNCAWPGFSHLEALAIGNNRLLPQQSVTMFSNIDDIESYIDFLECKTNKTNERYLGIFDLPVKDRTKAMRDLDSMGITAASLFPGLDGTCKALKEKYF